MNKTKESVHFLLQKVTSPAILLISCPYQHSPISPIEINEYMARNGYVINNFSSTYLSSLETCSVADQTQSVASHTEHFDHQQNYTEQPYAVDTFMFPQSQGYSILEKQYVE